MKGFARLLAIIGAAVLVALLVANIGYPQNYSKGYTDSSKSAFIDTKDLFTAEEAQKFENRVKEVSEMIKMNVVIYLNSTYYSTDWDTIVFTDDSYDARFGEDTDGLFYLMDFSDKSPAYDHMSLSGRACLQFDEVKQYMVDSMGSYLPSSSDVRINGLAYYKDDIANGINYFLDNLVMYCDTNREVSYVHTDNGKYIFRRGGDLYVTYSKPPFLRFRILLIGEIAGFIVGLIVYLSTKSTYRFKAKVDPGIYLNGSDVHFYTRTDAFLRSHTSRYNISSGSGGGGGGGGRTGGGGHSFSGGHTGAGHHR